MNETTEENAARWRHHLDALLRRPEDTIVLGGVSPNGSMSLQVGNANATALLSIARSLIEQAQEIGGGDCCQIALDALPDPLADDEDDDGPHERDTFVPHPDEDALGRGLEPAETPDCQPSNPDECPACRGGRCVGEPT